MEGASALRQTSLQPLSSLWEGCGWENQQGIGLILPRILAAVGQNTMGRAQELESQDMGLGPDSPHVQVGKAEGITPASPLSQGGSEGLI
jgi:hypothetical protein